MVSISSFGQAVQETLLSNYLNTNFENSILEFRKGKIFLKNHLFLNFKCKYIENRLSLKDKRLHFEILPSSSFI